ncbi:MAG TPA: transketolase C-terminal domain-containing protein, partial [Planctomycetota bacterium]|nr:transketolase C-terminal domain-containing protein [Planctomycetota bacterium]
FGEARIVREGSDLTMLSYGLCVELCREAAVQLAARGIEAEIIDLRSLQPYDRATCIASLQKTGRGLFVQEATGVAGVCDRVIADVLPDVFAYLHAPIQKVTGAHVPFPSSPMLEDLMMPDVRAVLRAALEVVET